MDAGPLMAMAARRSIASSLPPSYPPTPPISLPPSLSLSLSKFLSHTLTICSSLLFPSFHRALSPAFSCSVPPYLSLSHTQSHGGTRANAHQAYAAQAALRAVAPDCCGVFIRADPKQVARPRVAFASCRLLRQLWPHGPAPARIAPPTPSTRSLAGPGGGGGDTSAPAARKYSTLCPSEALRAGPRKARPGLCAGACSRLSSPPYRAAVAPRPGRSVSRSATAPTPRRTTSAAPSAAVSTPCPS